MIKYIKKHLCGFFASLRRCSGYALRPRKSSGAGFYVRFCLSVAALGVIIALFVTVETTAINQNNQSISDKQSFFPRVTPGRDFSFPQDHNIHADFQTEWWYVTANLLGEDGLTYGAQFTLFRNNLLVGGKLQPIFFAHAALTSPSVFFHAERFARADMGHGGIESDPWLAFLDHWQFRGTGKNPLPGSLSVSEKDFSFNLKLSSSPYFLQGDNGFSKKNASGSMASYYYSAPFIELTGQIHFDGKSVKVTGDAWFDREWSSTPLTDGSLGWDWLTLHLDSDTALMLYRVRTAGENYLSGTVMKTSGQRRRLSTIDINWRPLAWGEFNDRKYPIVWQLTIPSEDIELTITPINNNQFLDATTQYWEGAVKTSGSHSVKGYLELFGY